MFEDGPYTIGGFGSVYFSFSNEIFADAMFVYQRVPPKKIITLKLHTSI